MLNSLLLFFDLLVLLVDVGSNRSQLLTGEVVASAESSCSNVVLAIVSGPGNTIRAGWVPLEILPSANGLAPERSCCLARFESTPATTAEVSSEVMVAESPTADGCFKAVGNAQLMVWQLHEDACGN